MDFLSILEKACQEDDLNDLNFGSLEPVPCESAKSMILTAHDQIESCNTSNSFITKSPNVSTIPKPKRPLSAYNIFFQHEREKIISKDESLSLEHALWKIRVSHKPVKRRHRKSHGMIGFAELARTIAEKWKNLDNSQKLLYEEKAALEKSKYRVNVSKWEISQSESIDYDLYNAALEISEYDDSNDDDPNEPLSLSTFPGYCGSSDAFRPKDDVDSLSNLLMTIQNEQNHRTSEPEKFNVQEYISLTQRTLEMARASLSLPLFSELPVRYSNNNLPMMTVNGNYLSSQIRLQGTIQSNLVQHNEASRRMNANSMMLERNDVEFHSFMNFMETSFPYHLPHIKDY
jgi:HMG-box domain